MKEEYYTIGEVSKILNLSKDMIRYYEKKGVLHSVRDASSNYRRYTTMDIYWLMEAMEYKSWGIEIRDISQIRSYDFIQSTDRALEENIKRLRTETNYNQILAERLMELKKRQRLCLMNIGNFWVRQIPAYFEYHLTNGEGDEYERITLSDAFSKFLFDDKMLPFIDSGFNLKGQRQEWVIMLEEQTIRQLGKTLPEGYRYVPQTTCLCTNADIGEIGAFRKNEENLIKNYAKIKQYRTQGEPRALLTARGSEGQHFRRIVEYRQPLVQIE